jgi:hypothetical protein
MAGAIDGVTYPGNLMAPQAANGDEWIADVLTYARNAFGNDGPPLHAADVARVRKACAARTRPWSPEELEELLPVPRARTDGWKLSASHVHEACERALDGKARTRWSTGTPMAPGMWFQIDFGSPFTVRELLLDCAGLEGRSRARWATRS